MALKLIHSEHSTKESGWIETTTYKSYYLDEKTGEVTYEESQDCDNPYKSGNSYTGRPIEKRVLKPLEIPENVRKKIRQLMKSDK